jgi:tRNA(fMet)-specific endonuclease VapC
MTYIWDTNIILHSVRDDNFFEKLNDKYEFSNPHNELFASIVSIGEIHAIALRNRWGDKRMANLAEKLQLVKTISINNDPILIKMYAEIDVYSQSQHPILKLPTPARKMGKNDLWIAATTAVHNAVLLSTDNDFNHLDGLFLAFDKIIA